MSCVLHSFSLPVFAVAMQLIAKDSIFVCLHGKQKLVSTPLLNRRNTPVSTRGTDENYPGLHGYPCDISKYAYRHQQWFLWVFSARESSSGNLLMVFLKIDEVFAVLKTN